MSAIQLLEQLGANAVIQRDPQASAAIKAQALAELDNMEQPIHQWCVVVPAEEEEDDSNDESDGKDSGILFN